MSFWSGVIADSTANIIARRRRFNHLTQELYELPIVVWDSGEPSLSSTSTLTLRVCPCQRHGRIRLCQGEAFLSSAGLSTGALIAILLCIVILLGKCGRVPWGQQQRGGGGGSLQTNRDEWKGVTRAEDGEGRREARDEEEVI